MRIIKLGASITASNDKDAAALRARLKEDGTLLVNVMSSAGSGKTTLLSRLITDLQDIDIAVMEADIESDVDAKTIEALGAAAIQVHTGGMCHMDAGMTTAAFDAMGGRHDLVFLENVGNLVCAGRRRQATQISADVSRKRSARNHKDRHSGLF